MDPLLKENKDKKFSTEVKKLGDSKSTRLSKFAQVYAKIKDDPDITRILEDSIRIKIHKRQLLFDILRKYLDIFGDVQEIKYFIEYLLIHGLQYLNQVFIHTFISLTDLKIPRQADGVETEFILTQREILRESHKIYFLKQSQYLRNISLHGDPSSIHTEKLAMQLIKKELTKNVSFYTKYPIQLQKIFGSNVQLYKHYVQDEDSDLSVIAYSINQLPEYYELGEVTEVNHEKLIGQLIEGLSGDDNSFKHYTKKYAGNAELFTHISDPDYLVEIQDLNMLSVLYKVGFCLYTNRFSGDINKYELFVIVHEDLITQYTNINNLQVPMLCFYQHYDETEVGNKELKNIIIDGSVVVPFHRLVRDRAFKRALSRDE